MTWGIVGRIEAMARGLHFGCAVSKKRFRKPFEICEFMGELTAMAKALSVEWRKDQVPQELKDLHTHLEKLPLHWREALLPLCDRVRHFMNLQTKLVRIAQDAVDQLQLDVKYLLFDVEATRRERDELKEILEELDEGQE
jgi:hypothetical protein